MIKETRELKMSATGIDIVTKVIIVILAILFSYFVVILLLSPLFVHQPQSWQDMMGHMMNFNQTSATMNLIAVSLALGIGLIISLFLLRAKPVSEVEELKIIKRALSEDEKAVIDEITRADEITQDSLRFRLDWSKAKLSRILTNLDKMNIIQRERVGKTYNVFMSGRKRSDE